MEYADKTIAFHIRWEDIDFYKLREFLLCRCKFIVGGNDNATKYWRWAKCENKDAINYFQKQLSMDSANIRAWLPKRRDIKQPL